METSRGQKLKQEEVKTSFYGIQYLMDSEIQTEAPQQVDVFLFVVVFLPKIITNVIFIVLTLAFGISPRELVRRFSASSNAILWRLTSVNGTRIIKVLLDKNLYYFIKILVFCT